MYDDSLTLAGRMEQHAEWEATRVDAAVAGWRTIAEALDAALRDLPRLTSVRSPYLLADDSAPVMRYPVQSYDDEQLVGWLGQALAQVDARAAALERAAALTGAEQARLLADLAQEQSGERL